MLTTIHERLTGWVTWTIVILVGSTLTLFGLQGYLQGGSSGKTVAVVNGKSIGANELDLAYQRLKRQLQMQQGTNFIITPEVTQSLKTKALDVLIVSNVIQQGMHKQGYNISNEQVEAALLQVPAFQVNGQFSKERLQQVLGSANYSLPDFMAQFKQDLLQSQVRAGIIGSAFVLPNDINKALGLIYQTRSIQYLMIPSHLFANQINVSSQAMQQYYQTHQNKFSLPEKVSVDYIELSLKDLVEQQHVSDQDIKNYYNANLDNYKSPQQYQLSHILVKIPPQASDKVATEAKSKAENLFNDAISGKSFAELAKQHSDDIISGSKGGELGWFTHATLDPSFVNSVATLNKPGQITKPFRTDLGFEIIKLADLKPSQQTPLTQVQAQIKQQIARDRAQKAFATLNEQLADLTFSNPNTLSVAAKQLQLPIKSTELFTRGGDESSIAHNKRVALAAFSDEVLQQGNNSDVIPLDAQSEIVLRIKQHIPSKVKPFAEVKADIQQQLVGQESLARAKALAEQFTHTKANQLNNLSHQYQLNWQTLTKVSRQSGKPNLQIIAAAFDLPDPKPNQTTPLASAEIPGEGYAVVRTTQVFPAEISSISSKQKTSVEQQLLANSANLAFEYYVQGLIADASIKVEKPYQFSLQDLR